MERKKVRALHILSDGGHNSEKKMSKFVVFLAPVFPYLAWLRVLRSKSLYLNLDQKKTRYFDTEWILFDKTTLNESKQSTWILFQFSFKRSSKKCLPNFLLLFSNRISVAVAKVIYWFNWRLCRLVNGSLPIYSPLSMS